MFLKNASCIRLIDISYSTEDFFMYISFKYNNIFNLKLMTDFYCKAQFWFYISFGFIGKSAETLVLISFDIKLLFIISIEIHS